MLETSQCHVEAASLGEPARDTGPQNLPLARTVRTVRLAEIDPEMPVPAGAYAKWKRRLDLLTALLAGVVLIPFLLLLAFAIRLDSKGPVLFRQRRVGAGGIVFELFKFRTMYHSASAGSGEPVSAVTVDNDPRVTRLGRLLRRTRIDELPQILNVLRGEMSWIGPRPEAEILSNWYETELFSYRYRRRYLVRPGITGWAQVNQGHVSAVDDVISKLEYDLYYIANLSARLDLMVVIKTVRTVVTGFGSR